MNWNKAQAAKWRKSAAHGASRRLLYQNLISPKGAKEKPRGYRTVSHEPSHSSRDVILSGGEAGARDLTKADCAQVVGEIGLNVYPFPISRSAG